MKVLVLGGDGYLGWPTAMHLSSYQHDVLAVDNYLRRNISREENMRPLCELPSLHERCRLWNARDNTPITCRIGDLKEWDFISAVFSDFRPDAIIHYAEQPSAPYSMLNRRAASLTLNNNLSVTSNVIFATREYCPDAHIIKLGTMGEYGTPNIDIEEGWIDIEHKGRTQRFLYPRQAGSLYHTTKIMDTDLLWFYVRTWGLRVTDLMQGPVYGVYTDENRQDSKLLPFSYYDEIFGTVLNRFAVQAVARYPLTVYGKGNQTRGYLNIKDTLQCVRLSLENPADQGELRIFNQFTETFSVNQLAELVSQAARNRGYEIGVKHIENPRIEMEEHYYQPAHTGLQDLGLQPHRLTVDVIEEEMDYVEQNADNIVTEQIFLGVKWA